MYGPAVVECKAGHSYSERLEEVKDKRTRNNRLTPCEYFASWGVGINLGGLSASFVP